MPRNTSTNPDIRAARNELGARLRDLRRAAGLTGQQLAASLSWNQPKVSKIENGRQTPTDDDVRSWCRAAGDDGATEALLADLHTLQTRHREWRRVMRTGLAAEQTAMGRKEQDTRIFRGFQPTIVPGLLQTPEYARGIIERAGNGPASREAVDEVIAARMQRQNILYNASKKFRLVLTEAALLNYVCPPAAMHGQIDRLINLTMLPNVRLGVIPYDTPFAVVPLHAFWVYDDQLVMVETVSAQLNLAQPQEIEQYTKVFEAMALDAVYEEKARKALRRMGQQVAARE
ncbi:helix-turn-helix domain-containing protein [Promicromonospora sp. NPDC090134]|uniref:helix-turn-helix domain-containing protein n=1 Tax=Promicromonospora sp. NPDC090134 TaxID=3364408 RepID=UPI003801FAE8